MPIKQLLLDFCHLSAWIWKAPEVTMVKKNDKNSLHFLTNLVRKSRLLRFFSSTHLEVVCIYEPNLHFSMCLFSPTSEHRASSENPTTQIITSTVSSYKMYDVQHLCSMYPVSTTIVIISSSLYSRWVSAPNYIELVTINYSNLIQLYIHSV